MIVYSNIGIGRSVNSNILLDRLES